MWLQRDKVKQEAAFLAGLPRGNLGNCFGVTGFATPLLTFLSCLTQQLTMPNANFLTNGKYQTFGAGLQPPPRVRFANASRLA